MATVTESRPRTQPSDPRFLIQGIGWDGYEKLLEVLADRPIRVTYDRGDVELMSPSIAHEKFKVLLGIFVRALVEELEIPCVGLASTTWRRRALDRGLEADECFYLAHAEEVMTKNTIDLAIDPPPDLALEIDITSSSIDRGAIYAALRIPEIWRFDGESIRVSLLQPDGFYSDSRQSAGFPQLPLEELANWVQRGETMDQSRWGREIRQWVRRDIVPLFRDATEDHT
jgi:Uma2 family endonuclease